MGAIAAKVAGNSSGSTTLGPTTPTTFTQGSVLFAGTAGVLSQNNTAFKWTDASTQLGLTAGAATYTPLKITLAASQSADAFQVFASDGTTYKLKVTKDGNIDIADASAFKINGSTLLTYNSATNVTVIGGTGFYTRLNSGGGPLDIQNAGVAGTVSYASTTPAQITSGQNNYSWGRGYFGRLSTNASQNITGLTYSNGVGFSDGEIRLIVNVGSSNIVLVNESASSTAANRFTCSTGADITLSPNQAADLIYDLTAARWRVFKRN